VVSFIDFTEEFLHPKNNKIKTRVEKYFINLRGLKIINASARLIMLWIFIMLILVLPK